MYKNQALFFSLIVLNITIGANNWSILSIHIGQFLYYIILLICLSHAIKNNYKNISLLFLIISFIFKFLWLFTANNFYSILGDLFSGLIIVIAGSILFGRNPNNLHKILSYFFLLSIPMMFVQKIGLNTFFYAWNAELFHVNSLYVFDEVEDLGKIFKDIPLATTLFVDGDNISSPMYQTRPTGFLYSNNVLSIFLSVLLALHFSIDKKYINTISYLSVSLATVLMSSLFVFATYLLLSLFFVFKRGDYFVRSLKSIGFLIISFIINYIFFPGLVSNIFSDSFLWSKLLSRFYNVIDSTGFDAVDVFYDLSGGVIDQKWIETQSYELEVLFSASPILDILSWEYLSIILVLSILMYLKFMRRTKVLKIKFPNFNITPYWTILVILILSQFSTFFLKSPFFQICFGVALFPILTNIKSNNINE